MNKMKILRKTVFLFFIMCVYSSICFSQNIILPDNADSIVLIFRIKDYKEIPEIEREKIALKNRKKKPFLRDIKKLQLIWGNGVFVFCSEIRIYNNKNMMFSFETNGLIFYDKKNNLFYQSKENLLEKYWRIVAENACR